MKTLLFTATAVSQEILPVTRKPVEMACHGIKTRWILPLSPSPVPGASTKKECHQALVQQGGDYWWFGQKDGTCLLLPLPPIKQVGQEAGQEKVNAYGRSIKVGRWGTKECDPSTWDYTNATLQAKRTAKMHWTAEHRDFAYESYASEQSKQRFALSLDWFSNLTWKIKYMIMVNQHEYDIDLFMAREALDDEHDESTTLAYANGSKKILKRINLRNDIDIKQAEMQAFDTEPTPKMKAKLKSMQYKMASMVNAEGSQKMKNLHLKRIAMSYEIAVKEEEMQRLDTNPTTKMIAMLKGMKNKRDMVESKLKAAVDTVLATQFDFEVHSVECHMLDTKWDIPAGTVLADGVLTEELCIVRLLRSDKKFWLLTPEGKCGLLAERPTESETGAAASWGTADCDLQSKRAERFWLQNVAPDMTDLTWLRDWQAKSTQHERFKGQNITAVFTTDQQAKAFWESKDAEFQAKMKAEFIAYRSYFWLFNIWLNRHMTESEAFEILMKNKEDMPDTTMDQLRQMIETLQKLDDPDLVATKARQVFQEWLNLLRSKGLQEVLAAALSTNTPSTPSTPSLRGARNNANILIGDVTDA